MKKRRVAEAIIAENEAHEGVARTHSAERAQESWEEFKEKANKPFEEAIDKVTGAARSVRAKKAAANAVSSTGDFLKTYRKPLLIGVGVIAAAMILARLFSSDEMDIDFDETLEG